ncbi:uroporphyrinogen decarboxylase family protein [Vallitalea guaymasensis]|uniref:uroporphyrinogen decarboxylase family protein n=1 Tax=Vallitalea guaymasensis TaxID=1185412 RepID=UPI002357B59D|nr:uroporphyrinogen decarboxylase family protein [Vallitalea guaymasensis]
MNKKERVIAAIEGRKVDHIPSCFTLHFAKDEAFGEKGINSHLNFFKETDTDIFKIMNENLVPYMGDIKRPDDWNKIKTISIKDDFMVTQIDMIERILDKCDTEAFNVGTLHGTVASSIHPIEAIYGYEPVRKLFCTHMRENKTPMIDAYKRITEGMCQLAEKYIEIGLDGIYYAALGGENYYFTDEEFEKYIAPLDKMILQTVKQNNGYNILHMCKDKLNLDRYKSYAKLSDIVNWGVYEDNISLEEGRKLFGDITIMGGLQNRAGVLVDGTDEEIEQEVKSIINSFGKEKFILGADCTLPTEISYKRVNVAVNATKK